jgi:hypothetical protein
MYRVEEKQLHIVTQLITKVTEDDRAIPQRMPRKSHELTNIAQHEQPPQRTTRPISPMKVRYYAANQPPTLTSTPWDADHHKRLSFSPSRRQLACHQLPAHVFEQLPHEIYSRITGHLEATYTTGPEIDASGRKQALRTLCLTSKRWAKAAIEHLYSNLVLPSSIASSLSQKRSRRFSVTRPKSQLDLLVRTLCEAPSLAFLIQSVHVSTVLSRELTGVNVSPSQRRSAHRLLRNVIETCTEVEIVSGYSPPATKEHAEWFGLLFSCERVRAHAWMLDLDQTPLYNLSRFTDLHDNWQCLQTLVICRTNVSSAILGPGIISAIANRLPSLRHLMVSNFSKEDFHNGTLLSLKPLLSLRLENLPGITDQGLAQLADSPAAASLSSLSLIHLNLASLQTIQTLLSNLSRLRRFRFVQNTSPILANNPTNNNFLSSPTLEYLHWDLLLPGPATSILAASIATGTALPNLHTLKAPSDPEGELQALCRPIQNRALTASDSEFLHRFDRGSGVRSLRLSRLQAQLRVRESWRRHEVGGVEAAVHGSYLGDVTSRIEYALEPDVEGTGDEALASLGDLVGKGMARFEVLF